MLIHISPYGQLGNRLQLFAQLIAFAIENNQSIANLGFKEYARFFKTTRNDIFCRYPQKESFIKTYCARSFLSWIFKYITKNRVVNILRSTNITAIYSYPFGDIGNEFRLDSPDFLEIIGKHNIIFSKGYYFVDYLNLLKHADKIREYFIPIDQHCFNIDRTISDANLLCDLLIGVHIRRGDYEQYLGGRYYYTNDIYIRTMRRALELFPDKKVGFLVCSDEVLEKESFDNFIVTYGTGHLVEDMYSLAKCDYIIGPSSTFSRWASFYGKVPTYLIRNPEYHFGIEDFLLYDDIVYHHLLNAPQFPKYEQDSSLIQELKQR